MLYHIIMSNINMLYNSNFELLQAKVLNRWENVRCGSSHFIFEFSSYLNFFGG